MRVTTDAMPGEVDIEGDGAPPEVSVLIPARKDARAAGSKGSGDDDDDVRFWAAREREAKALSDAARQVEREHVLRLNDPSSAIPSVMDAVWDAVRWLDRRHAADIAALREDLAIAREASDVADPARTPRALVGGEPPAPTLRAIASAKNEGLGNFYHDAYRAVLACAVAAHAREKALALDALRHASASNLRLRDGIRAARAQATSHAQHLAQHRTEVALAASRRATADAEAAQAAADAAAQRRASRRRRWIARASRFAADVAAAREAAAASEQGREAASQALSATQAALAAAEAAHASAETRAAALGRRCAALEQRCATSDAARALAESRGRKFAEKSASQWEDIRDRLDRQRAAEVARAREEASEAGREAMARAAAEHAAAMAAAEGRQRAESSSLRTALARLEEEREGLAQALASAKEEGAALGTRAAAAEAEGQRQRAAVSAMAAERAREGAPALRARAEAAERRAEDLARALAVAKEEASTDKVRISPAYAHPFQTHTRARDPSGLPPSGCRSDVALSWSHVAVAAIDSHYPLGRRTTRSTCSATSTKGGCTSWGEGSAPPRPRQRRPPLHAKRRRCPGGRRWRTSARCPILPGRPPRCARPPRPGVPPPDLPPPIR